MSAHYPVPLLGLAVMDTQLLECVAVRVLLPSEQCINVRLPVRYPGELCPRFCAALDLLAAIPYGAPSLPPGGSSRSEAIEIMYCECYEAEGSK